MDKLKSVRDAILTGEMLAEVKAIEASLRQHGLQVPLSVIEKEDEFLVVDGKKRLAALRRLAFNGDSADLTSNVDISICRDGISAPEGISDFVRRPKFFRVVSGLRQQGVPVAEIVSLFGISFQCVRDLTTLGQVHDKIRDSFFAGAMRFDELQAFAAIPDKSRQFRLWHRGRGRYDVSQDQFIPQIAAMSLERKPLEGALAA